MKDHIVLGVDIGGTGIKGALVNIKTGELTTERFRIETPRPANPTNVAATFGEIVNHFKWKGIIGCGFPAVIKDGVAFSAANIHDEWIGTNVEKLLKKESGCKVTVLNDADAAGQAEMTFGEGKGKSGTVILITIGTGLGSAIFLNGEVLANTEFGHIYLKGHEVIAEQYASNAVRKNERLTWEIWAERFKEYLEHVQFLFNPDLFILGGGASKKFDRFQDLVDIHTPIVTAKMLNNAGIIGAAVRAHKIFQKK